MTKQMNVSLETAKRWYNSNVPELVNIAISLFGQKALEEPETYDDVLDKLSFEEMEEVKREMTIGRCLLYIAKYFNRGWNPKPKEPKFFMVKGDKLFTDTDNISKEFYISCHRILQIPGIAYFKNKEDVKKAFKILKKERLISEKINI